MWKPGPSRATEALRAAQQPAQPAAPAPPTPAAPAWPQVARIALPAVAALVLLALAILLRDGYQAPPPMAVATVAPTAAAPAVAPPAPPPAPAAQIAVGFVPGGRDQAIPADAQIAHLGPVEWVSGATECFVEARYGDQVARVWGPCAALGLADAPAPTPIPTSPPPPPPAPAPVYRPAVQAAPAAPEPTPSDLIPILPTAAPGQMQPAADNPAGCTASGSGGRCNAPDAATLPTMSGLPANWPTWPTAEVQP